MRGLGEGEGGTEGLQAVAGDVTDGRRELEVEPAGGFAIGIPHDLGLDVFVFSVIKCFQGYFSEIRHLSIIELRLCLVHY